MENQIQLRQSMLPIRGGKICDLLKAKPMIEQIRVHGIGPITLEIKTAISKCAFAIGITLSHDEIDILSDDLIDVYTHDSIEDIIFCLQRGRQGFYGTTYGKLNMIVIQEWMTKHLEQKAIEREREHEKQKKESANILSVEQVHEGYKKLQSEIGKPKEKKKDTDTEYARFKAEYEKSKLK